MPKSVFTPAYQVLVEALVDARKSAGVSQVELARRLNRPQPFISQIERKVRRVDVVEFCAIAKALKIDPRDLFEVVTSRLPAKLDIS